MSTFAPKSHGVIVSHIVPSMLIPNKNRVCQTGPGRFRRAKITKTTAFATRNPFDPATETSGSIPSVDITHAARMVLVFQRVRVGVCWMHTGRPSFGAAPTQAQPAASSTKSRTSSLPESFRCSAMHAGVMSIVAMHPEQRDCSVDERKCNRHCNVIKVRIGAARITRR
jgi:hypothetical protein